MEQNSQGAFILVHGVGVPAPGEIVEQFSKLKPDSSYSRSDVVIDGTSFARLVPDDDNAPHLIEVNWSDIERPKPSVLGAAEWIVALSFALTRTKMEWTNVRLQTAALNRLFFETVLLWVLFPVLLGFAHANLSGYPLMAADAAVMGVAVVTLIINRPTTKAAQFAGEVTLAILVVLSSWMALDPGIVLRVNSVVIRIYGAVQIFAGVLIFLATVELTVLAVRKKLRIPAALARLAFSYLPLVLLSALGSVIWAVILNVVVRLPQLAGSYSAWQRVFLANLGYDLKTVEWAMAAATAGLGVFAIAALISYEFANPSDQGRRAHKAIYLALIVMPLMLAVPGAAIAATSPYFGGLRPTGSNTDVWQVYTWSAMRVVPWLLAAVTPITTLLDVLSDVVFYITDRKLRFSSFEACNHRFELLFRYAQTRYRWIHVVAHSQGSVIAYMTLGTRARTVPTALTTVGSPLGSLYRTYLDWDVARREMWLNLFRSGDYIGGAVDLQGIDHDIGPGGHTGYWSDPRLVPWLDRQVSS